MLKKQEPISYTFDNLTNALHANNYIVNDYMCENPWSGGKIEAVPNYVGSDYTCEYPWSDEKLESVPGIKFDNDSLSEIISQAVREALKGENLFVTPKIEKYLIKHR